MLYIFISFFSLILTLFFTPHLIRLFKKSRFLDIPSERKAHKSAVPLGGGIIIYAAVLIPIIGYAPDLNAIRFLILSSSFLFICGIWDDVSSIHWGIKFSLQALAALNLTLFLSTVSTKIFLFGIKIPSPFSYIILIFFIIGVLNAFNFLDGLDGLVAAFSAIAGLVLLTLSAAANNTLVLIITAALAGSLLGFLKFNSYPAKIFLGDTGALILGFFILVSSLLISAVSVPGYFDLTFPIILMSAALADALKVIIMRLIKGKSPFHGDRNHLHHILLQKNIKHKSAVFIINFFTLLFSLAAVYYLKISRTEGIILYILMLAGFLYMQFLLYKIPNINIVRIKFPRLVLLPLTSAELYKKYFFPVSVLITLSYIIMRIPSGSFLDRETSIVVLIMVSILFLLSWYNRIRPRLINDIYVLINISIFLVFTQLSPSIINIEHGILVKMSNLGVILLAVSVIIFLAVREKIFAEKKIFLTGFDLIFIIVIACSFMLSNMIESAFLKDAVISIVQAFIVYLWYKVVIYFDQKYLKLLYYSSFALPLLAAAAVLF